MFVRFPFLFASQKVWEKQRNAVLKIFKVKKLSRMYGRIVCLLNFQHSLYMYLSQQTCVFRWLGFPTVENPKGSQELKIVRPPSTRQGRHCSQHVHLSQQALPWLVAVRCWIWGRSQWAGSHGETQSWDVSKEKGYLFAAPKQTLDNIINI